MLLILSFSMIANVKPIFVNCGFASDNENVLDVKPKTDFYKPKASLLAIVIDDFGGFELDGVDDLLDCDIPITCAIMPFVDNSETDYARAINSGKEVILHMPMQAHVNLPESWYGSVYIKNTDTPETAIKKVDDCLASMPEAKGFNIHIGSGASQKLDLMKALYDYANQKSIYFLDSRTILEDKCEEACLLANCLYLGRDVFLEPSHNRSHAGVTARLEEGAAIAKEKGYAIVIGHVGPEGGINTSRAIIDFAKNIDETVEIVPLSTIYTMLKNQQS